MIKYVKKTEKFQHNENNDSSGRNFGGAYERVAI